MLTYKNHARKRMRQRSISEAEVEYCLKNHDISYTDKKRNPIYIAYTHSNRRIKVIVDKDNLNEVITVAD